MRWSLAAAVLFALPALAESARPNPTPGMRVGPHGGKVPMLHFAVTGDTRPPKCKPDPVEKYPEAIIRTIADDIKAHDAQFVIDLGDHMNVCGADATAAEAAKKQMALYMEAVGHYGGSWFMTMGNHECTKPMCAPGDDDVAFHEFMRALAPYSARAYYSVDVETSQGLAVLVMVADNAWDAPQAKWLEETLARADAKARYTIVAKHHPPDTPYPPTNVEIDKIIRAHKFTLYLTGHLHLYAHPDIDQGRVMIMGTAGAPMTGSGGFYGYAIVDQLEDGKLQVSVYDTAGDLLKDRWAVGPNG